METFAALAPLLLLLAALGAPTAMAKGIASERCFDEAYCITTTQDGEGVAFVVENLLPVEITIRFDVRAENMTPSVDFPFTLTLPADTMHQAFTLEKAGGPWRYFYLSDWAYGAMGARHDEAYPYRLPFAEGERFRVSQGFFGDFSHHDQHAVDFAMPEGTPVHAARAGIVVAAVDTNTASGTEEHHKRLANYLLIRHDDGTLGAYYHLQPGGLTVEVGDFVGRGEPIALSGSTGFSKGPHLHFSVYTLTPDLRVQTVPFRFKNGRRWIDAPVDGRRYRARS